MTGSDSYQVYISVIIPVYNCEEKLVHAVRSILRQPLKEMEIVIVDDGSTDGTGKAADSLGTREERVSVIHQKHRGAAAARNAGILKAEGKYVAFYDVEDEYVDEAFDRRLAELCRDSHGMIMCSSLILNNDRSRCAVDACWKKETFREEKNVLAEGYFAACLYRKDMLVKNHIFFGEEIRTNKDFKVKALIASSGVRTDSRLLYLHMPAPAGRSSAGEKRDAVNGWKAAYEWLEKYESPENTTQNRRLILQHLVSGVLQYAGDYIREGNDPDGLMPELEKLGVIGLIRELPEEYMQGKQRKELKKLQNHTGAFARKIRYEARKQKIRQALLRPDLFRRISERRAFPLKSSRIDGPYTDIRKAEMKRRLKNHHISSAVMTVIIALLIGAAAVFPLGYTVAVTVLLGLIALLIVGIPSTALSFGIGEDFDSRKHVVVCAVVGIILAALYYIPALRCPAVYYLAVLIPIMLIQILFPLTIVKYSLNIARILMIILVSTAGYLQIALFQESQFVVQAITTSLFFEGIVAFYKANDRRVKEKGREK